MSEFKQIANETVNLIYNDRRDFMVIGLTGRTGSGCSTVASILETMSFKQLSLREPKKRGYVNSEEIKYNVVYNYIKENWDKFIIIKMTNIISSFLFENTFQDFINYFERLNNIEGCYVSEYDSLKKKLQQLEDTFIMINSKIIEYKDNDKDKYVDLFKNQIPHATKKIKEILSSLTYTYKDAENKRVHAQLYTYVFQDFGNNIRSSGNPYYKDTLKSENIFALARRSSDLIKQMRYKNSRTLFCINAIRNPYEATYFKDRFSAFYLFSINTEDHDRIKRLSHLDATEIKSLDDKEYPKENNVIQRFYHQNIEKCIELSDIYIFNPSLKDKTRYFLTEQIIKYITLIKHPGLITPTRIERCMQIAYNAKLNSGCLSRQVGAVVTDEFYSVKAVGWNDVPEGQVACNLRDINTLCQNKDRESYSYFELTNDKFCKLTSKINTLLEYEKLQGRQYPYCFKDIYNTIKPSKNQVHTRALHAEENAFLQISKYGGEGIKGGNLFTTASPCELCSKKAYQLGIKKIYYIDPYPGISGSHILDFGSDDNKKPQMVLFFGAIGSAYTSLYTQRISYKDELNLITGLDYDSIWEDSKSEND